MLTLLSCLDSHVLFLKASSCVCFFFLLYSFVMNICHFVTNYRMKGLAPPLRLPLGTENVMHVEVLLTVCRSLLESSFESFDAGKSEFVCLLF